MFSRAEVRSHERGLASLEFVMVLPILMVITFLAVMVVKLGHLRMDMQISARNNAYAEVYKNPASAFVNIDDHTPTYIRGTRVSHPLASANAGSNFYDASATGHERFGALRANTTITPTVRASSTIYQGPKVFSYWKLDVREQYAVAGTPIWERQQIPLGYDQYLYDRLKDHSVVVQIPGFGAISDFIGVDLGDLYSGYASDAVTDVFPKVNK